MTAASLGMRILLLFAVTGTPVAAQVGNAPGHSPFRDIRKGHTLTATGGYFGGSGGQFNVGPHRGEAFGGRYDIRSGSALQIGLAVALGNLNRFIVDPTLPEAEGRSGPVRQSITFAEIALQFNLSGGKSWHRIAPFIGAGVGMAFGGDTPADASLYEFGNEVYFAPSVGLRFFLSDRLHLRGEARAAFWNLSFPVPLQVERSEWIVSPWFQVGLGYSFSP